MIVFSIAATLVALGFALRTFRSAEGSRAMYVWSFALMQFAIAAAALCIGLWLGWTDVSYKIFYLFGAVTNVIWLGLGSVWLLAPVRLAVVATALCVAASAFGVWVVWTGEPTVVVEGAVPLGADAGSTGPTLPLPDPLRFVSPLARALARWYSIAGSVAVAAGAVFSALRDRQRAVGLLLLAVGVAIVGGAGSIADTGASRLFPVGLAVGIAVMYAGFARTQN